MSDNLRAGLGKRTAEHHGRPLPVESGGSSHWRPTGLGALTTELIRCLSAESRSLGQMVLNLGLSAETVIAAIIYLGLSSPLDRPVREFRSPRYWQAAQVRHLVWLWCYTPATTAEMAAEFDRSRNSVTAKLRSLGLYSRDRAALQTRAAEDGAAQPAPESLIYLGPGRVLALPEKPQLEENESAPTLNPQAEAQADGEAAGHECESAPGQSSAEPAEDQTSEANLSSADGTEPAQQKNHEADQAAGTNEEPAPVCPSIAITEPELKNLVEKIGDQLTAARATKAARNPGKPCACQKHTWGKGAAANDQHRLLSILWDRGMYAEDMASFMNATLGTTLSKHAIDSRLTDIGLGKRDERFLYRGIDPQLSPYMGSGGHLARQDVVQVAACLDLGFLWFCRRYLKERKGYRRCPRAKRKLERSQRECRQAA
jgi:hypothetical protein